MIHHFVGMGFSRETVIKAINENEGDNDEDIMETLLSLTAEKPSTGENDEILSILVDMGFTFEEACTAIDKCGPKAEIGDLADFISASQLEEEIDSLQDLPRNKRVATADTQTEQSDYLHTSKKVKLHDKKGKYRISWSKEKVTSAVDMGMIHHPPGPMTGFGVPNEASKVISRELPSEVTGKPYFYFENVALAPKGVWNNISRFLYEIEPEFVDSKYFCAAMRKRGYIHNLPIHNRFSLLPIPPLTIREAFPSTQKWWPSWDKRTKLNCLLTGIGPGTVTDRIRKTLEQFDDEPPQNVQENVLQDIKKWNLVWVGKNKLAPLEPDEYEMLLGFPKDHTRGGGVTRTERYRALGNAFQVDTVAYHLSVLKDRFPNGINVLSLFSGIGGAEVALHRLGIMLKNVVSVEIAEVNRNIIHCWWEQTNQKGNLIEVEDVQKVSSNQLRQWITKFGGFDLIIGGSPCNNFSGSNRVSRHGLEGEHSSLFYEYYRILEAVMEMQKSDPE
ncbi:DNA (cytosine-5)-methyltransferase DRM2-like [Vigna unguiculata]|uniref:DNA (cytosine-5)-methyltransferase DRM2-like n=1 Tax=Vigna unguiculata TaxID=3917 RepID=UPI001016CB73|nr:DNA (cytosine-5)-methyltransferase DRM2-like [Vigna unguiculata]